MTNAYGDYVKELGTDDIKYGTALGRLHCTNCNIGTTLMTSMRRPKA